MLMTAKSFCSSGVLVIAAGRFNGSPKFRIMLRDTIRNVANRKNMMSMSGMISMRARLRELGDGIIILRPHGLKRPVEHPHQTAVLGWPPQPDWFHLVRGEARVVSRRPVFRFGPLPGVHSSSCRESVR